MSEAQEWVMTTLYKHLKLKKRHAKLVEAAKAVIDSFDVDKAPVSIVKRLELVDKLEAALAEVSDGDE